jgi:glycosyltransferase involved in cell wall biosynthesis
VIETISHSDRLATAAFASNTLSDDKPELRVLQVFHGLGMGGAETWLMSLLRYFRRAQQELPVRIRLDILLTGGAKDAFDDEATALGARLFYVPFTRRNILGFTRKFRSILEEGNYHAIHDHQDYISGLHFLMGGRHLPPVRVAHVHNPLYHRTNYANGLIRRVSRSVGKSMLARMATHVVGTSRQIVTEYGFDSFDSPRVSLGAAHCGFDVDEYMGNKDDTHAELCREFGWDESAKIILFVGRLEGSEFIHMGRIMSHKNPGFALEVAKQCCSRDERVRLLMVGSGDTRKRELEAIVKESGLGGKIRFPGIRNDVPRLMLGSNLLLFPSLAEGMGMVVVEAQAAGLHVLASDTTPHESVVVPELVNFMSLNEASERWADEALRLIKIDHQDSGQANQAVRESPFSIENSAARLLNMYGASKLQ